ncbi:MAG: TIR domain-containing protein [Fusobacteriaceae bacterium]
MIYFFKPEISELDDELWIKFYDGAISTLNKFRPQNIREIISLDSFSFNEPSSENDLVIFFNPISEIYELENILNIAVEKNITIFPIATNEIVRRPSCLGDHDIFQSFDLLTEKKLRGLDDQYMSLIGECFGREVIISHHPALFDDTIKIFLSYKRVDFEDKSKIFKDSLHEKKENVFIDLHELRTGDNAQEKIVAKLKEDTDVLIFIQTKNTFNSEYQLIELKKAFELSIPILWVTLNLTDSEIKKLPLFPVGSPHYNLTEITPDIVNKISNCAFDLIRLKKQRLLDDIIYKFNILKQNGISYAEICNRNNIYQITKKKMI